MVAAVGDSTFFTTLDKEKIMAFGGKNSDIDGFMPYLYCVDCIAGCPPTAVMSSYSNARISCNCGELTRHYCMEQVHVLNG